MIKKLLLFSMSMQLNPAFLPKLIRLVQILDTLQMHMLISIKPTIALLRSLIFM